MRAHAIAEKRSRWRLAGHPQAVPMRSCFQTQLCDPASTDNNAAIARGVSVKVQVQVTVDHRESSSQASPFKVGLRYVGESGEAAVHPRQAQASC
jgi:hypothetical protein